MTWTALCIVFAMNIGNTSADIQHRTKVCQELVVEAKKAKAPVEEVLAISWREAGLRRDIVSHKGAVGPLQILPRWHCPRKTAKGCDLFKYGVLAWLKYKKKYKSEGRLGALCHYNSGNTCGKVSKQYAKDVNEKIHELLRMKKRQKRGKKHGSPH